jgi:mono/diheme cytochrome c family protein
MHKLLGCAAAIALAATASIASQATAPQHPDGGTLLRTYCGSCHGAGGKGDGPLAQELRVRPPDLTQIAKQNGGTFPADKVRQIIDGRKPLVGHGGGDMPVWGEAFKQAGGSQEQATVEVRIDALVDYIKSLQEQ